MIDHALTSKDDARVDFKSSVSSTNLCLSEANCVSTAECYYATETVSRRGCTVLLYGRQEQPNERGVLSGNDGFESNRHGNSGKPMIPSLARSAGRSSVELFEKEIKSSVYPKNNEKKGVELWRRE